VAFITLFAPLYSKSLSACSRIGHQWKFDDYGEATLFSVGCGNGSIMGFHDALGNCHTDTEACKSVRIRAAIERLEY
jgi:hypothetical protein